MLNTDELWEIRVKLGFDIFRFLRVVRWTALVDLDPRVPEEDPKDAAPGDPSRGRSKARLLPAEEEMSDLQNYIKDRKARVAEFATDFDFGYEQFKIGVMLKREREEAG